MNKRQQINEEGNGCASSLTHSNTYQLPKIKIYNDTYYGRNTIVIGKRATGKTFFIIYEIYRHLQHLVDRVYVFSSGDEYNGITDKIYQTKDLNKIYSHITGSHDKKTLIIFDNVNMDELPSQPFSNLIFNGRNLQVSIIIATQYPTLNPHLRSNIDNCIIAKDNNVSSIKRLYEQYFGTFSTLSLFQDAISCLGPYCFLCQTLNNTSNEHDEKLGWCRADIEDRYLQYHPSDVETDSSINQELVIDQHHALVAQVTRMIDELVSIRNQLKNLAPK